jgi:hypothetical protein
MYVKVLAKMVWVTVWAIFSKTHLVTLVIGHLAWFIAADFFSSALCSLFSFLSQIRPTGRPKKRFQLQIFQFSLFSVKLAGTSTVGPCIKGRFLTGSVSGQEVFYAQGIVWNKCTLI